MITAGDPRRPGGVYRSGYWQETYTVTRMFSTVPGRLMLLTCDWADGRTTTHCTPWDPRRDEIVSAP